jgi:4-amino-4-deoxy-L-arabinose transferase-like glycosyltransferase
MENRQVRLALAIGIVAVAVRFIAIDQAFVDDWSWRQSDVAAIARNFLQNGFHFAYPQIDWAGDQPGYVGTEFPILPFLAALTYRFTGIHAWVGRVQAVLLFALSLPFFFLLVRKLFDGATACWALLFYSFAPLNVMASRCFMPDVPSLSLSIIALYLFLRWTETDRLAPLLSAALATSLAILIKVPTAVIGVPMAVIAFERFGFAAPRRPALWLFGAVALLPSLAWYWHAHRVSEQFYPYHFFGAGGIQIEPFSWYWRIVRLTIFSSLTLILSALAMAGLFVGQRETRPSLFRWWGATMLLSVIIIGYGNRHPWYQLPFVPIAAVFAGHFCSVAQRLVSSRTLVRVGTVLNLVAFAFLSFSKAKLFYRESAKDLLAAGLELKTSTPANALIVAADYGDPTVFYYAERKGWHFLEKDGLYNGHPTDSGAAIADLENLRQRGATHVVFYSSTFWWLDYYKEFADYLGAAAHLQVSTPVYKIYRLNSVSR